MDIARTTELYRAELEAFNWPLELGSQDPPVSYRVVKMGSDLTRLGKACHDMWTSSFPRRAILFSSALTCFTTLSTTAPSSHLGFCPLHWHVCFLLPSLIVSKSKVVPVPYHLPFPRHRGASLGYLPVVTLSSHRFGTVLCSVTRRPCGESQPATDTFRVLARNYCRRPLTVTCWPPSNHPPCGYGTAG